MKIRIALTVVLVLAAIGLSGVGAQVQSGRITIRTENFPRPPYSGATYYIYERDGETICTKLEVCNKYDDCETTYKKGSFKEQEDIETGDPYGTTKAVTIPTAKLKKHACLVKFKLL
jgi:hypothetical protein